MVHRNGKSEIRGLAGLSASVRSANGVIRRQPESGRRGEYGACGSGAEGSSANMSAITEQLVSVVAEEAEHCERLLGLMRHQQEFLIQGDTRRIEANVREQEVALRRSRYLECRRRQLVSAFAKDDAFNAGTPNLAQIIATVSDDYGNKLASLRSSMQRSIERLRDTGASNRTLIEQSLGKINELIHSTQAAVARRASC